MATSSSVSPWSDRCGSALLQSSNSVGYNKLSRPNFLLLLIYMVRCKELANFLIDFVIFIFIFIFIVQFIFISLQVIVVSTACRSVEVGYCSTTKTHCSYFRYISSLVLDRPPTMQGN